MSKQKLKGSIYLNKKRYWWKVRLPGEEKAKAYPLRPVGAKFATQDKAVAVEVAKRLWEAAIFESEQPAGRVRTIAGLTRAYLAHAKKYYCGQDGKTTREPQNIKYALAPLVEYCPTLLAEEFSPLKLKEVQQKMIGLGWCRNVVNQRIGIVKRMFKWASSEQLIPAAVFHGLQTVEGLRRGRSGAKETEAIKPIAESCVFAILPHTTPTVAAMIKLQLLTGMRSGELVIMRPMDIETGGAMWLYRPATHKTAYRGQSRTIYLGQKAQAIIKPFLLRKLDSYCFVPAESESHRGQTPKAVKPRYDKDSYRKAVNYAIKAARKAGLDVLDFHPHQLRHTAATKFRREYGLDTCRALLGHRTLKMADDYAELDTGLAANAMAKIG